MQYIQSIFAVPLDFQLVITIIHHMYRINEMLKQYRDSNCSIDHNVISIISIQIHFELLYKSTDKILNRIFRQSHA